MLFNSYQFIFLFLPFTLAGYFVLGKFDNRAAVLWLALASLVFYSVSNWEFVPLLVASVAFNYSVGWVLIEARLRPLSRFAALAAGVIGDILVLGYFKYAGFVAANLNMMFSTRLTVDILLPVGISFYTFTQIAFLVDAYRGKVARYGLPHYALFVTYFPHLIAGPILHHKDMIPQFEQEPSRRPNPHLMVCGLIIFSIGLFKKTCMADAIQPFVALAFGPTPPSFGQAWIGTLAYTFQLYFDFSGYSDMAIGLGRMLGVKLPLNFHSPLRAPSIIDYWRRWHMTLQRFIVSYIFQPMSLPLNRLAAAWGLEGWNAFLFGAALPILITFTLSGLWHGAGWTYVLYGLIHGVYLSVNEAWREYQSRRRRRLRRAGRPAPTSKAWMEVLTRAVTLLAVIWSQVMFRSATASDALGVWRSMSGLGTGNTGPAEGLTGGLAILIVLSAVLIFLMPNSQQIMGRFDPAWNWREWRDTGKPPISWTWKPNLAGILFVGGILFLGVCCIERGAAIFLYFNF
jgi:D-alanyl-lipoteichoic acid acyltransferase DltB (MBOAT superfamily)